MMSLVLEQRFPLGRFHATRWNQNPFEDPYGEWPPSPWRLLRALTARWNQYHRERSEGLLAVEQWGFEPLERLLAKLAGSTPSFWLPPAAWRGRPIKQYQPTSIAKEKASDRKYNTTLIEDHYWTMEGEEALYWFWKVDLTDDEAALLDALLERVLYFGRSESYCRFKRLEHQPEGLSPNCVLSDCFSASGRPVLAPAKGKEKECLDAIHLSTDDKKLSSRDVPPGTTWHYAVIPDQPPRKAYQTLSKSLLPMKGQPFIQFAVGGRVYPPPGAWVRLLGRFRGRVIKRFCELITGDRQANYAALSVDEKDRVSLISGKDAQGLPLRGHPHAHFAYWPDINRRPSRLVVWRRETQFDHIETRALLEAASTPLGLQAGFSEWSLVMVPLPFDTPIPGEMIGPSRLWQSVTPFVPPQARHRFRRGGRERPSEKSERLLARLLEAEGRPAPIGVDTSDLTWTSLHLSRRKRPFETESRTTPVGLGNFFKLTFEQPVEGPLALGESSHFGLGLFKAIPE
ncbi:MAG: type I-U CRISPR-associated protein Csb2 [Thermodesulfobacteriota bacterium]